MEKFYYIKGNSINYIETKNNTKTSYLSIRNHNKNELEEILISNEYLNIRNYLTSLDINKPFKSKEEVYLKVYSYLNKDDIETNDITKIDKDLLDIIIQVINLLERTRLLLKIDKFILSSDKTMFLKKDLYDSLKKSIIKEQYNLYCIKEDGSKNVTYICKINKKIEKQKVTDSYIRKIKKEDYLFLLSLQEHNLLKALNLYIDLCKKNNNNFYREKEIYNDFMNKLKKYQSFYEIVKNPRMEEY